MTTEEQPSELEARPQSRREWSGWLRSLVLPLAIVVAIVAGLLYYESHSGSGSSSDAGFGTVALPVERNPTAKAPSSDVGRAAPDFVLQTLDGGSLRLSDLQGHPALVNFWASWCDPCRQETPDLVQFYEQHRDQGIVVVGVNLQEAATRVRDFTTEFGVDYPVVMDQRGQVARTWHVGGPVEGIPASYFIDAKGVVRKVVLGTLSANDLVDGLALITRQD